MRILLSAYVSEPGSGSEPEIGWVVLQCAARSHEVTLLTQPHCARKIVEALPDAARSRVTVIPIAGLARLRRFHGRWGLGHLDYAVWQLRAWRAARGLRGSVDIAHHATFGTDWMPSAMLLLGDVPVVWGPVGGTSPFAWRLARFIAPADLFLEVVREIVTRSLRLLTATLVKRTDAIVIARNDDVRERFEKLGVRIVVEPLVGLPAADHASSNGVRAGAENGRRRALYISRLTSWKGALLAVHTMAELPVEWQLEMYGEGPAAARIGDLAQRLGVADRVHLMGRRPREEVFQALEDADVLLFPSMRDSAPYPVVEAVRVGCPVVCLDAAGPPQLIKDTGGIAVAADGQAPRRLAAAMTVVRRGEPDDRWSLEGLVTRVDGWYAAAADGRSSP